MYRNFTKSDLNVSLSKSRNSDNFELRISSDYSNSLRKSKLWVSEDAFIKEIEYFWKKTKTKKLLSVSIGFNEIDWYDSMTDIYTTPIISMKRGLKKAKVYEQEHGSIPKEWGFNFYATFAPSKNKTPFIEVIHNTLGSLFTSQAEKDLTKKLSLLLQGKIEYLTINIE